MSTLISLELKLAHVGTGILVFNAYGNGLLVCAPAPPTPTATALASATASTTLRQRAISLILPLNGTLYAPTKDQRIRRPSRTHRCAAAGGRRWWRRTPS